MRGLTTIALFTSIVSAAYRIEDDYTPNNFASMFDFFTGNDPTDGYVNYVDQGRAQNSGLYKIENNQVYMGVDNTNVATGRGRDSIRISSKKAYNHGLIILDLAHMPAGACGTWPAFWLLGPDWPNKGEVDIIEGVNSQQGNSFALHTNSGCSIQNTGNFAGTLKTSNCDSFAPNQPSNAGCAIQSNNDQSYGTAFNNIGGGVYATEWTSEAITIWFFPRSAIPADITSGAPNPDNWGLPSAEFKGDCDIDQHVVNQQIIFDVTFCGQWAGSVWSSDSTCASKAGTCQDFVKNNPTAFQDTYWSINSLKVYQDNGTPAPAVPSSVAPAPPAQTVPASTVTTRTTLTTVTTSIPATTPVIPTTTSSAVTTPVVPPAQPTTSTIPPAAPTTTPAAAPPPAQPTTYAPVPVPAPSPPARQPPTPQPADTPPNGGDWRNWRHDGDDHHDHDRGDDEQHHRGGNWRNRGGRDRWSSSRLTKKSAWSLFF